MTKPNVVQPYLLTFENRKKYLLARVDGELDSPAISLQYWSRVAAVCERSGFSKVLVVEALAKNLLLPDAFRTCCAFRYEDFLGLKIAFVDLYADHAEVNDFNISMSTRRGVNISSFASVEAAENWLLDDEEAITKIAAAARC